MKILGIVLLISLVIFSCKKENINQLDTKNKISDDNIINEQMTQLIRKLDNPYSVSNMKNALDSIQRSNKRFTTDELEIVTTHLYLKFKPKNNNELEILKDDSSLILYSYPLDYDITLGTYYHDPSIPDSLPTYQYCSVPVDKKIPSGIEYELLDELFIPDENKDGINLNKTKSNDDLVSRLVEESFRLTGNLDSNTLDRKVKASNWRPAGKIRFWDDVTNNWRGVEGVIVKARNWFTTHQGIVDANGNYSCDGTFKGDANYSLDWERYDFALREAWLDGANINGPKKKGNWDNDFTSGKNFFHAKVFLWAYRYYHLDIDGLKRPPKNAILKTQMHIRCYDENGVSNFKKERRFMGLGSAIKIYSKETSLDGSVTYANSERLLNVVSHELAHASHWELRKNKWNNNKTEDKLIESWAMGVAWKLTRKVYFNHNHYAFMTFDDMKNDEFGKNQYTPIIIDLLDNLNQGGCCSKTLPIDEISGYTIKNIEDVLKDCETLSDLKDQLKNKYQIINQSKLDYFFNQYINL